MTVLLKIIINIIIALKVLNIIHTTQTYIIQFVCYYYNNSIFWNVSSIVFKTIQNKKKIGNIVKLILMNNIIIKNKQVVTYQCKTDRRTYIFVLNWLTYTNTYISHIQVSEQM